jgi:hypothetical protein
MNTALELHHGLIRKLLHTRPHMGYESATEGDSFILSFHTPQAALAFAQVMLQSCPSCRKPDWEYIDNTLMYNII